MFNACIFGIEQVTTKFLNYNTSGLTKELLMDKDFQKDILRLCLKYLNAEHSSPEITVPLKILSTMLQVNAANEMNKINQTSTNDTPKPSTGISAINDKFSDLLN